MERRTTPESTTITKTRKSFEVKNSSSPERTRAAGKPRNTQMLEDVDERMLAIPWCDHAEKSTENTVKWRLRRVRNWPRNAVLVLFPGQLPFGS